MRHNEGHNQLRDHIRYLSQNSAFYKDLFVKHNIDPSEIKTISDLSKIPFTTKNDLNDRNADFICVAPQKLVDHVTTSGTTANPITLSLTDKDLDRLAENESQSFKIAGITDHDVIQVMTTMDRRFMAGLAYFLGARKLGAGVIRVGNGLPELQWETIFKMKSTVLICVPSFLVKMLQFADDKKIDYKKSSVKKIICIGEAIRNPDFTFNTLGKNIIDKWNIALHASYASSEMATAFTECDAFNGGHQQNELIITECVDENGEIVADGIAGELVVTPLGVEGMPLLRYKTGDICIAHHEKCSCGRTSLRLGPILGRKNQMIKYKGTSFYPGAIYQILDNYGEIENYQVEIHSNELNTDEIIINIGLRRHENFIDTEITNTFKAKLRVVPRLNFLDPVAVNKLLFPENNRKPLLFVDKRST